MKKEIELQAQERSGKPNALRAQKKIPAVVYGKGMEAISLEVEEPAFKKVIGGLAGSNVIISLKLAKGSPLPVLAHEIQKNPVNDQILHIDFYRVKMDEAIKTRVHIVIVGEAAGVKEDAGILVNPLSEIEIKCLPGDIPEKIEVNVSDLKIGDAIHVSELKPPKGVEIISIGQDIVVTVSPPTKEEEVAPAVVPLEGEAAAAAAVPGAPVVPGAPAAPGAAAPVAEAAAGPAGKGPKAAPGAAPAAVPAGKPGKPGKPEAKK